ncbi:RNA polymerase I specific transcription initiation factor RRN3 [Kipferlia bialata]|uniref:RNA polymerase I specific transcription initiation factor RRN3 n=1 Tax=Kipferlia bialata TaxID=797122 RepID=A0A9K3CYD9_9EUKA|nr:RNA polymerase I specific transcription initiation factor RRN3 [Kipferlia bialata]GIQ84680.1 RNA polymerase I specific transcription initiation factor RRN3 [Kipferlia bialata]|eukprot:g3962.t1
MSRPNPFARPARPRGITDGIDITGLLRDKQATAQSVVNLYALGYGPGLLEWFCKLRQSFGNLSEADAPFVAAVVSFHWVQDDHINNEFLNLAVELVSYIPSFSRIVLAAAFRSFLPVSLSDHEVQIRARASQVTPLLSHEAAAAWGHKLTGVVLKRIPSAGTVLESVLYATVSEDIETHLPLLENALKISDYLPTFTPCLVTFGTHMLSTMDVNIVRTRELAAEEESSEDDVPRRRPAIDIGLGVPVERSKGREREDTIMHTSSLGSPFTPGSLTTHRSLTDRLDMLHASGVNTNQEDVERQRLGDEERVFDQCMAAMIRWWQRADPARVQAGVINALDTILLPTQNLRYSQFVVFTHVSLNPSQAEAVLTHLLRTCFDPAQPMQRRLNSAFYIGSMLARAGNVPLSIAERAMGVMLDYCHSVARLVPRVDESMGQSLGGNKIAMFYVLFQAVIYALCFILPEAAMEGLQAGVEIVAESPLAPLAVVLPSVASEFARVAQHHDFCAQALSAPPPTVPPVLKALVNSLHLESAFPFDPYPLPLAGELLQPLYREWRFEEDDHDEESDLTMGQLLPTYDRDAMPVDDWEVW